MTDLQHFQEAYALLEAAIWDAAGQTVREYEDTLSRSPEADKLQVCRILRNYAAHHEDGQRFLSLPEMTKFLQTENQKFRSIHTTVETVSVSVTPLTLSVTLKQALTALRKSPEPWVPVVDREGKLIGALDTELLIKALGKVGRMSAKLLDGLTRADLTRSRRTVAVVHPGDRLDAYAPGARLVLVDGAGKVQKMVSWKKLERKKT